MFGNEATDKILETLTQTARMIGELISRNSESIRTLDDQGRRSEKNINTIADFLSRNAPTITATPWETSNLNLAYEKMASIIEKQDAKIGRLEEIIAKSVAANFRANEETKNNLNVLINAIEKSHDLMNHQGQINLEFFRKINEDYPKSKSIIEYLLLSTATENSSKKIVK